jgi:hypothetical protein
MIVGIFMTMNLEILIIINELCLNASYPFGVAIAFKRDTLAFTQATQRLNTTRIPDTSLDTFKRNPWATGDAIKVSIKKGA